MRGCAHLWADDSHYAESDPGCCHILGAAVACKTKGTCQFPGSTTFPGEDGVVMPVGHARLANYAAWGGATIGNPCCWGDALRGMHTSCRQALQELTLAWKN